MGPGGVHPGAAGGLAGKGRLKAVAPHPAEVHELPRGGTRPTAQEAKAGCAGEFQV
jgi:hypothetical protein